MKRVPWLSHRRGRSRFGRASATADAPGATSCDTRDCTSGGGDRWRSPRLAYRTIRMARAAAVRGWLRARTTSGNSPTHGAILAVIDRALQNPRMSTRGDDQRLPAARKRPVRGGVFPAQRACLHLLNLSGWPMLRSVAPQCYPRAARASRATFSEWQGLQTL